MLDLRKGPQYRPLEAAFDEMVDGTGMIRQAWLPFLEGLQELDSAELEQRLARVHQLIRENGVTFNVYGAEDGAERPWRLDPFPLILDGAEWAKVEAGLQQRARLLELLLEDVYGEQRCLREGLLPPDLIYGSPGYLRPCQGLPIPAECRLLLHAVDLARSPEGGFRVLRDRAEVPAGCGYALENRLALSRMLPELLSSAGVINLAPFFRSLRNTLAEMAERAYSSPRVVFLTPGPANQTYFEHAYLAQYLGFNLVQGDDLTVRDNRVFLKLLEGLQPVDVILRRLRDTFCDPLELRTDSVIGVPGLVQAVKAGNVVVANSLGSGWLETPALHAYLPRLCRELLSEDLVIPGVTTWWCGEPKSLERVLSDFEALVLKPTFPQREGSAVFLADLSSKERRAWRSELQRNGSAYVAQEHVRLSCAPTLAGSQLEPRRVVLRTFITRESERFVVMPGGLTLVAQSEDSLITTLQQGAGSKDTWIATEKGEISVPEILVLPRAPMELTRGGGDIPSRSADNLYWLGRYLERGEGLSRLLRCCIVRLDEQSRPEAPLEAPVLLALSKESQKRPSRVDRSSCRRRILEMQSSLDEAGGLRPCLDSIARLANTVRDRISDECWRLLNHLAELGRAEPRVLRDAQKQLDDLLVGFSSFSGMLAENMTRSHSWRFLEMGRRIERALNTVTLLRRSLVQQRPFEDAVLEAVLEVADGTRTYRRRYPGGLQVAPVVDLLLADESNPRSVLFQLERLRTHFDRLPGRSTEAIPSAEERLLYRLVSQIRLAEMHDLVEVSKDAKRASLVQLLRRLEADLPLLSDLIVRRYLTHLVAKSQQPGFGREVLP